MEPKNILLFLFLLIVATGMRAQENTADQPNAYLGSITWPDMPQDYRGDLAITHGWKGDTIPSFDPHTMNYVLTLPLEFQQIPALIFSTLHPDAIVEVTRAKSLWGPAADRTITFTVTAEDSSATNVYSVLLRREQDPLDIEFYKSIVYSKMYKVSEGNGLKETIKGVITHTTVADFYAHITKADELQTLKVIAAANGAELTEADVLSSGDTLVVLSADNTHTSKYILEVTALGLSSNALLTSSIYTVSVTGSIGTITGFPFYALNETVMEGVVIPAGATLTLVDQYDAYMPLVRLNSDTVYVNTQATQEVYIEVIAENGANKVLYRMIPTSPPSYANVTSDFYMIHPTFSTINYIPQGTSVASFLRHLTPAWGATMMVVDQEGTVRHSGVIDKEDRLVVTAEDGTTIKIYYFTMEDFGGGPYFAYIISEEYEVNQITRCIYGVTMGIELATFKSKLLTSWNATMKMIDQYGNESTQATLTVGDRVLVTSGDSTQTAIYSIEIPWNGIDPADVASTIRILPNPTTGRVVVQGLLKGHRLRVLNPAGIALYEVMAGNSTQTVFLDHQPAGIYLLEISAGKQTIKTQKVVKK